MALNPDELDLDTAAMQAKYEQSVKEQQSQLRKEDLSDMVAEHAAKQQKVCVGLIVCSGGGGCGGVYMSMDAHVCMPVLVYVYMIIKAVKLGVATKMHYMEERVLWIRPIKQCCIKASKSVGGPIILTCH